MTNANQSSQARGQQSSVQTHPDGSKTFTHSQRYPDNNRTVTQEYNPQGQLVSAKVVWAGFAGNVLDVTATFDSAGKLIKEVGYRAPDMKTPVSEMLKPLPNTSSASTSADAQTNTSVTDSGPVVMPSLAASAQAATTPATGANSTAKTADESSSTSIHDGLEKIYGHQTHPQTDDTKDS